MEVRSSSKPCQLLRTSIRHRCFLWLAGAKGEIKSRTTNLTTGTVFSLGTVWEGRRAGRWGEMLIEVISHVLEKKLELALHFSRSETRSYY